MRSTLCSIVSLLVISIIGEVQASVIEYFNETYGSFSSPKFPHPYDNNLERRWIIEVQKGYRIQLHFTVFDLEDSYEEGNGSCLYDYVELTEGNRTMGRFCGNSKLYAFDAPRLGRLFYSRGNNMSITFQTDYSNENITPVGFSAHYVEIDVDECAEKKRARYNTAVDWDQLLYCNHYCHNVPGGYYCSCRTFFTMHSDGHTCRDTSCESAILTAMDGVITSTDYPKPYTKLTNCTWVIAVETGFEIVLTFDQVFSIEDHVSEHCPYDFLTITGKDTFTYCGDNAPNNGTAIYTKSNVVTVHFQTDHSVEKTGFRIRYHTPRVRCTEEIAAPAHGKLEKNRTRNYSENEDVVTFSCDVGYKVEGHATIRCLHDGSWDNPPPRCVEKSCGDPEELLSVDNSHIVDYDNIGTTYKEVVTVECDEYYELVRGAASWVCGIDEEWVESDSEMGLPECRPICGVKGPGDLITIHISGGTISKKNEWPWLVFFNFDEKYVPLEETAKPNSLICGGSLISSNYVLTAAHCVTVMQSKRTVSLAKHRIHIWLGVHTRTVIETKLTKYSTVSKIAVHPNYNRKVSFFDYDVAVIKMTSPVTMTEAIRPVCLPSTHGDFNLASTAKVGFIAGWGNFENDWDTSLPLRHAQFPIHSREDCRKSFEPIFASDRSTAHFKFSDNVFCAGFDTGFAGTCRGDSGGPFVVATGAGRYTQIGLVSTGKRGGCGFDTIYTIYAMLNENIMMWVRNNTNNLE